MPWNVEDDEPEKIKKEILNLGVRCENIEIDLTNENAVETIYNTVEKKLGTVSILINNAAYSTITNLDKITNKELDKHYYVNLKSVIMLTSLFVKQFKNEKHGRIINMTSGQSLSSMNNEIAYAVTKGAIETFTKTMQHELAFKDITINSVNPGLTDSGWLNSEWMNDKQTKILLKRFPKGRMGLPTDAAKIVSFLVNENADWITGQIIHSEGGFIRESYEC